MHLRTQHADLIPGRKNGASQPLHLGPPAPPLSGKVAGPYSSRCKDQQGQNGDTGIK